MHFSSNTIQGRIVRHVQDCTRTKVIRTDVPTVPRRLLDAYHRGGLEMESVDPASVEPLHAVVVLGKVQVLVIDLRDVD